MLLISRNCIRAGAARHTANVRLLSDVRLNNDTFDTAGRMGDAAAASMHDFMKGAEGAATSAGDRVEARVAAGGFVASGATVPNPDHGPVMPPSGISFYIMGDIIDLVLAAVQGDHKRVVADMARHQNIHLRTSSDMKLPRTTAQDWPRGSITDPAAARRPPPTD